MKTILSLAIAVLVMSSSVFASQIPVNSQEVKLSTGNDVFTRFIAHREHNGVALHYTINAAHEVSSMQIERSWDGEYFDVIGEVAVHEGFNKFHDTDTFPGFLYYRITAIMKDGSRISSDVEVVRIVKKR